MPNWAVQFKKGLKGNRVWERLARVTLLACVLALALMSAPAKAGVIVTQNVSPGATNWPGVPLISTVTNPASTSVGESFNSVGGNTNMSETFTVVSTNYLLQTIDLYVRSGTGTGVGTNLTLNLYDLGVQSAPNPSNYTAAIFGGNLFGSGAGLPISYASQADAILKLDFTGTDQVLLQAGHMYAFELAGTFNSIVLYWQRGISDTYAGGAAYRNQSWINGNNARDFAMAVYASPVSYTITIPAGSSLIANHFDKGGNTLDEVLPTVPNGTQIQKWNCTGYTIYTNVAGVWTPASGTLKPGEGAFIINNSGAPFNLTFTGTPHVPVLPPYLPCGCGVDNLVSCQTANGPSTFQDIMGFPPANLTRLQQWNGVGFTTHIFAGGNWSGGVPSVNLGESVFIRIPSCSTAPTITCATNKPVECGSAWSFDAPTSITVNCYTNYQLIFNTVTNSLNPLVVTRTWTAFDLCGNSNSCSQTVNCCVPPPPMLIGWWPGDAYAFDISGNGNDGLLEGDANYGGGKVGQTFCFGSSTAQVRVSDAPSLNFRTNLDFSIDAWIRTINTSTATIVDKRSGDGSQGNTFGYSLFVYNGHLGFQLGSGPFGNFISSSPLVNDDAWHFVCATVNRLAKSGKLYVDGVLVLTFSTGAVEGDVSNSGDLLIGQRASFSSPISFDGCIDETEIFKCALTDAEIQSLWRAGSAGKCKVIRSICGQVFNDEDANGSKGATEPGLAGWVVQAQQSGGPLFTTTTDGDGKYCFTNLPPGNYEVSEIVQTDWARTVPVSGVYTITLVAGQGVNGNDFGNQRTACNVPPVICCPADIVGPCTDPSGTPVIFHPVAEGECDTNITLTCTPPSGFLFPFGVTTVNCTATDSHGHSANCSFNVTIVDNVPPALECPKNVLVACTNVNGTVVNYSVTATDNCDGNVAVTCSPPSGSVFLLGDTTVFCTAIDSHGNSNSCCFIVTVDSPTVPTLLNITHIQTNIVICWPETCGNYVLQATTSPTGPWTAIPAPVVTSGNTNCVTIPVTNGVRFFRLYVTPLQPAKTNLLDNPGFAIANQPGTMPSGSVASWSLAYGNPIVFGGAGCEDTGYIRLYGNNTNGAGLRQTLAVGKQFQKGKRYKFTACLRRVPAMSGTNFVRLRVIAFNNTLPSSGLHPAPNSDVAIIGLTGLIRTTNWTHISLPTWRANKDFTNIAFNVENPTTNSVAADLDDVCIAEVPGNAPCDDCQEAPTDGQGNVIFPAGFDPNSVVYESVSLFKGKVKDLYGGFSDTSVDTWYGNSPPPCATIGGWVPPDAFTNDFPAQLAQFGITNITPAQIAQLLKDCQIKAMDKATPDSISNFSDMCPIAGYSPPVNCATNASTNSLSNAFGGRDIVFVHGFDPGPLFERLDPTLSPHQLAKATWPDDRDAFYSGYWKDRAVEYWKDHIAHYFGDNHYHNRYLVVSWSTAQRMRFGVHAVLSQISDAMNHGTGVVNPDPDDARGTNCFGKDGYVLITHSTGAPLTDAAMYFADQTRNDPNLAEQLGDISYISDLAVAHIALHGAFVGSTIAHILLTIATDANLLALATPIIGPWGLAAIPVALVLDPLFESVCVDLTPIVSSLRWGPILDSTPVPVLTVAGAHSFTKYSTVVKNLVHAGFDDGVLTINSQSANPLPSFLWPSGYIPEFSLLHAKVFDMGLGIDENCTADFCDLSAQGVGRGIGFYLDQVWDPVFFDFPFGLVRVSAACVPGLSVTGMLQPVAVNDIYHDSLGRYHNHYSFLQTAANHSGYAEFSGQDSADDEEVRAVTDHVVYLSNAYALNRTPVRLLDPAVQDLMEEKEKGWRVTFTIPFFDETVTWWIWKRTYDRAQNWQTWYECDYVYKYAVPAQ